jgi:hypothetical protein
MNKQQTAVEWLIDELTDEPEHYIFLCDKPEYMYGLTKILEQALELEKQQIIDAWNENFDSNEKIYGYTAEQYYSKTFKK